jgi:serine/threonine protein kinase
MRNGQVLKQRYRLTQRIASGGMGEVWRAEDVTLHRAVAIKVLHQALAADPEFQHRFIQEARTLASLNAPGLIDLYDTCEEAVPDGPPLSYLVMEFVDGTPLSEVIAQQGRLDAATTMSILTQCATALEAAHGAGIVHRDIKPANILVGQDGTVTVIDFGIARTRGHAPLTAAGSIIGTVEYASPEQLRGGPLTGASDLYSLGVVGYECLNGEPPFRGESTAALITAQLRQQPAALPADLPPDAVGVIMTALAKEPAERFESAAALAQACRDADVTARSTRRMPIGHAGVPAAVTEKVEYEPTAISAAEEPPPSLDSALRKRTVLTAGVTLAVVLVIVAAVAFAWWAGQDSGTVDADKSSDKTSSPQSPSSSPSPTGPDAPEASTLVNAHNGKCVDIDFGFFGDSAVLADCDGEAGEFEFVASSTAEDVFEIIRDNDGEKVCLNWTYGSDDVEPGDCDFDAAWKFVWLDTRDGKDVWRIQSVSNSKYCLAVGKETPQGQDCTKDVNQHWHTTAAVKD